MLLWPYLLYSPFENSVIQDSVIQSFKIHSFTHSKFTHSPIHSFKIELMNKFIRGIVGFSLRNRFFIFFLTGLLVVAGVASYRATPLEAFPDITNTQIIIVSQWNGRSAEEIERFVKAQFPFG